MCTSSAKRNGLIITQGNIPCTRFPFQFYQLVTLHIFLYQWLARPFRSAGHMGNYRLLGGTYLPHPPVHPRLWRYPPPFSVVMRKRHHLHAASQRPLSQFVLLTVTKITAFQCSIKTKTFVTIKEGVQSQFRLVFCWFKQHNIKEKYAYRFLQFNLRRPPSPILLPLPLSRFPMLWANKLIFWEERFPCVCS